jgi:hypothetical protein
MSTLESTAELGRGGGTRLRVRAAPILERFGPLAIVALAVIGFIAISAWWVLTDTRLPNGDNGKHLVTAFSFYDDLRSGFFGVPFKSYSEYPPGVHMVGAIGSLIAGPKVATAVITENVVFVPMLAAGLYGVGRRAFNRFAGALAVLFGLAAPLVGALFHVFMLDVPTAAVVAVTVWALLASDRFANVRVSALAGLATAFGLYCKGTFVVFIAGLVLVMLLRGGWRNWRGLLAFVAIPALIAGPWYVYHFHQLTGQTQGAVNAQALNWYGSVPYPAQWSVDNFTWYWWNLVNNQLYLPLAALFVIGFAWTAWRAIQRRRDRTSIMPELLAGGVVSYIGCSLITIDDPRYTLPGLIYVAVIATGWIANSWRPLRWALAGALVVVLALNSLNLNWNWPGWYSVIRLPGHVDNPIGEGSLTVASPLGYVESRPDPKIGLGLMKLMKRARADGARQVIFDAVSMNNGGYNLYGLAVFARGAHLGVAGFDPGEARERSTIVMFRASPRDLARQGVKPCLMSPLINDGTALFIRWGPEHPKQDMHCPR